MLFLLVLAPLFAKDHSIKNAFETTWKVFSMSF